MDVLDPAEAIEQAININSEISYTDLRPADIDHSVADISKVMSQPEYEPQSKLRDGIKKIAGAGEGY